MAKLFQKGKGRKRAMTALSALLAVSLSLGVAAACSTAAEKSDDDADTATLPVDSQLIKNGNFEFYDEVVKEEVKEKKNLISTPNSWTFYSGSPSSDTASGIVDAEEWGYLSATGGRTLQSIDDAVAHWNDDDVTAYDRLKFYRDFKTDIDALEDGSEAKELFDEYSFRVDFEDLEYLNEAGTELKLHNDAAQRQNGDTSVLMIHNRRTSESVRGTAQYYNSSTTVTLESGTAAELSVWVKTAALYHYKANADPEDDISVSRRAGAYIGVTQTVGGTTLEEMRVKNINTDGIVNDNGWQQYTIYIRASSYATSTFRIKLGLGLGSSDDRYEAVDGFAFFDDLECKLISSAEYDKKTATTLVPENHQCSIFSRVTSKINEKEFDMDTVEGIPAFALDLDGASSYDTYSIADITDADITLTEEKSGRKTWTSADNGAPDNRTEASVPENERNIATKTTFADLATMENGYLGSIYEESLADKFPFYDEATGDVNEDEDIIFILSANGAAYTAKLPTITLAAGKNMLLSFWVKTGDLPSDKSGAGAILVDGENKTIVSPFDTNDLATVDLDDEHKDIYLGWTQCFFFVSNETETAKTFHIELTYGPTSLASATSESFAGGWAAFTRFRCHTDFSDTLMSYAPSSGDRAKKVSLKGTVDPATRFDTVKAGEDIEHDLALPTNFTGIVSGSRYVDPEGSAENVRPEGLYAGLLNKGYAANYAETTGDTPEQTAWKSKLGLTGGTDGAAWWTNTFGNASQPLAIVNTAETPVASYGFFANESTIAANSYQSVSVRVKLSEGATAYVYLTDKSDLKKGFGTRLSTNLPATTYWYDDEGNVCAKDPADDAFNAETDILYYLEENGLYTKKGDTSGDYYANLANYEVKNGNLVTKDGADAFYGKTDNGTTTYYAYYDSDTKEYSLPVKPLPVVDEEGNSITRYAYTSANTKEAVIKVTGGATEEWVDVLFYVHTGNEAKTYRLEVWAGARTDDPTTTENEAQIPAGSHVFFDNYKTPDVSSDFSTLQQEAVDALIGSGAATDEDDRLTDGNIALYYTYTFYDSPSYLRYDKNEDTEERGNPWIDYKQSDYSETLVYLYCADADGSLLGAGASHSIFLDYSAVDFKPDEAELDDADAEEDEEEATESETNIWLVISSGVLAFVLIFAVFAVAIRMILKKLRKSGKIKPKQPKAKKRPAPQKQQPAPEEEKAPEAPEKPAADEDDPYNE